MVDATSPPACFILVIIGPTQNFVAPLPPIARARESLDESADGLRDHVPKPHIKVEAVSANSFSSAFDWQATDHTAHSHSPVVVSLGFTFTNATLLTMASNSDDAQLQLKNLAVGMYRL